MKSTGIVRLLDPLGRIVLPIEIRRTLDLQKKDPLEIFIEGDCILLKKYKSSCVFCDSTKDLTVYQGKSICVDCLRKMTELLK
ncbi:MAG: AbrB/MazE/SpoVT family DNA-binding domain-containing protein [Christensenella sp.]|nr:AbrB/MazE/SpoVT family DNA-binding domain-containing protein [Christensenella sp.]